MTDKAKTMVAQAQGKAKELVGQAEAKIKETRDSLDKDHDGIPDALQGMTDKAKILAGQAQEKAKEVTGMAEKKFEQAKARVGDMADQTKAKLAEAKSAAEKAIDASREHSGMSKNKDSKKS